jgi:UV DNA damage endonuclease
MINTATQKNNSAIKVGLVCISEILKSINKKNAFQTMTRKRFLQLSREQALKELSLRILHNCKLTKKIILHCAANGISHYRISSCLAPLVTDSTLNISYGDLPDLKEIELALSKAGVAAQTCGVSISSHPDQFNVLSSYSQDVVNKSIKELNHQAYILDLMGLPQNYSAPMCLHLNLSPDIKRENLASYVDRFKTSLSLCSPSVQKRLVLENEHGGYWNCANLYECFGHKLPLVFDNLHNDINQSNIEPQVLIDLFKTTWGNYTPVMHWSEGTLEKPRSHAEFASHVPKVVSMNQDCVWEFELKGKDQAILQILKKDLALVA